MYVVTGGIGFIGSYIVKSLINEGHSVKIIDNLHSGTKHNINDILDKVEFHQIDIRNKQQIQKILKNCDGVFHEAALTSVPESLKIPQEYCDVNVNGTKIIFEIAKEENLKVVFASSSSIYGNIKKIPIKENFEKNPINPYGKTKLEAEKLAREFHDEGLEVIGLRYFNVYGKGQTNNYAGVITKFLENIQLGHPLTINGDGNQIRDFIHVDDVVNANIFAMKSQTKTGFFNIGTGTGTSINNLAEKIMDILNYDKKIIYRVPLDGDILLSQADTKLALSSLNWFAKIDLDTGLKQLTKND